MTGSLYTKDRYRSFASLSLSSGDAIDDGDATVELCAGVTFGSEDIVSLFVVDNIDDGDAIVELCAGVAFGSEVIVSLFVLAFFRSRVVKLLAIPTDEPIPPPKIVINSRIIGISPQRTTTAIKMAGTRAATQTMPNRRRIASVLAEADVCDGAY